MRVLLACEESQSVCSEFRKLGHEAFSCDILPTSGNNPEWHIQDDVFNVISKCEKDQISINDLLEGPVKHSGFKRLN